MGVFESHLTFDRADADRVRARSDASFKFSQIDGDPVLGAGTYCYLSGYAPDPLTCATRAQAKRDECCAHGLVPLRIKIERVIFDTKTGVAEIPW